mmetsp:Transcript_12883/g.16886  ORF Transcript_12883/g.16886 Transcript_12883/m.16886 type:complete len:103 (-) Transcript_12883:406-714(-)
MDTAVVIAKMNEGTSTQRARNRDMLWLIAAIDLLLRNPFCISCKTACMKSVNTHFGPAHLLTHLETTQTNCAEARYNLAGRLHWIGGDVGRCAMAVVTFVGW